jgi:KUP system potassium uptake protein
MLIDATFFAAAMHKVLDGGWFPLALGAVVFVMMLTWRRGRDLLHERLVGGSPPLAGFLDALLRDPPVQVQGTAVFMTSSQRPRPTRCCTASSITTCCTRRTCS